MVWRKRRAKPSIRRFASEVQRFWTKGGQKDWDTGGLMVQAQRFALTAWQGQCEHLAVMA